MPDSSRRLGGLIQTTNRWLSPWCARPLGTVLSVGFLNMCVIVLRDDYAGGQPVSRELKMLAASLAIAPVTWLLLAHPAVRRRAAVGTRFLFSLVIAGGLATYALSDQSRWMAVMTFGMLIGPTLAYLFAHGAVRRNREELAEWRHRELVAAAAKAAESTGPVEVRGQRPRGSVQSRARRQR